MKAAGKTAFYEPTKAEREALCTAMHTVYEQMDDRVGKDLVAAIQKEVAATN
jgi:C4-dicarboxylate-binding protein DctP